MEHRPPQPIPPTAPRQGRHRKLDPGRRGVRRPASVNRRPRRDCRIAKAAGWSGPFPGRVSADERTIRATAMVAHAAPDPSTPAACGRRPRCRARHYLRPRPRVGRRSGRGSPRRPRRTGVRRGSAPHRFQVLGGPELRIARATTTATTTPSRNRTSLFSSSWFVFPRRTVTSTPSPSTASSTLVHRRALTKRSSPRSRRRDNRARGRTRPDSRPRCRRRLGRCEDGQVRRTRNGRACPPAVNRWRSAGTRRAPGPVRSPSGLGSRPGEPRSAPPPTVDRRLHRGPSATLNRRTVRARQPRRRRRRRPPRRGAALESAPWGIRRSRRPRAACRSGTGALRDTRAGGPAASRRGARLPRRRRGPSRGPLRFGIPFDIPIDPW